MNIDLKGAFADVVPLAAQVWAWATVHYLECMAFALALVFIVAWGRRRKG